jgi:hypothetical protein
LIADPIFPHPDLFRQIFTEQNARYRKLY